MPNEFYSDFDTEPLSPRQKKSDWEYRNPFQIDRDRVIFSFAFRRLQSKTQVFQSGEYDFYRTRLTHSIEVAKLGRSICDYLKNHQDNDLDDTRFIDPSLTEAVCLAHDLGHPPFGHIGERKLNQLMAPFGGFEGNAQTVRILTRLIYKRQGGPVGMNPTRALRDGVMKYKMLFSEYPPPSPEFPHPEKHFLYDCQARLRMDTLGLENTHSFPEDRRELNEWKSIECQIMDWADDTAYSLNDIADGIQAGYITLESLRRWKETRSNLTEADEQNLADLEQSIEKQDYERRLSSKLGRFIQAVSLAAMDKPRIERTNRHRYRLVIHPEVRAESKLYKDIANQLIFQSPQIQQVEFKGSYILEKLFSALMDHYLGSPHHPLSILPHEIAGWIAAEDEDKAKIRRLCDFLAGLTDGEAVRLYRRLFDPDFGSITDLA